MWLADGFMDLGNPGGRYHGYSSHSDGAKRMIMELNIHYTDGTIDKIKSDDTWKTSLSPITYSTVFGGEDYDARNEKTGWDTAGYNDSSWANAITTTSPGGTLYAQSQPPVKVVETLYPVTITKMGIMLKSFLEKLMRGFLI